MPLPYNGRHLHILILHLGVKRKISCNKQLSKYDVIGNIYLYPYDWVGVIQNNNRNRKLYTIKHTQTGTG